ncbi:MAG: glycosyltransferase family 2 protein [Verrucomicrobiota bacterium]
MTVSDEPVLVSVIIVCYNCRTWLPNCLASIQQQTHYLQSEVILVDNASADGTEQIARELTATWPNAQVVQTGSNVGFAAANNRGVDVARGKYVYLLNPDTWMEADCLEQFYLTAERQGAGCVGGLILEYEDNAIQARGCVGFDFCGNGVEPPKDRQPDRLFFIHGFFFIRRDLYIRLGWLDETLFMYGEEPDLSWRVWICGEKIVPAPSALVHHRGSASVNPAGGSKIIENRTSTNTRFLSNRNSLLVIAKNCQHILLIMLFPCATLILLEGLFVLVMTQNPAIAKRVSLDAFTDCWRLRQHVFRERKRIRSFRRRGDFWTLRFFRLGFGRSHEIKAILKRGLPKFNR